MDSGSTISVFKDAFLVRNIPKSKHKLMLYTNSGKMIIDKEADVPGYVRVFFDEKAITNFFFLKDLIIRGRVEFDSMIQNPSRVQVGNKFMKFVADGKVLYVLEYERQGNQNQIEGYSHREVEKAKITRKLYHQLVAPSVVGFKSMLR